MIALLLALAPVTLPHSVDGYRHPPVERFFGNCIGTDAALNAGECPSKHCEHADCRDELERARTSEPHLRIECPHTLTTCKDDGEPVFRVDPPAAWSVHCYGPYQCTDEVDAYCKWHSDGTVEAKNATCSDRKGERQ